MDPESLQDLFEEIGPIRLGPMFGGRGIYSGDLIFGIVAAGEIYLKVDDATRGDFERAGSHPFTYAREGREPVATSYWLLPAAAVDDPSQAAQWARLAIEAGRRATETKSTRRRRR